MHLLFLAALTLISQSPGISLIQVEPMEFVLEAPRAGDILKGIIQIQGTELAGQITRYEVAFAFAGDTTGTWFLINEGGRPAEDRLLASWDTSQITDGDYRLRLLAVMADGEKRELIVPDLRVRNYTPVESIAIPTDQSVSTEEAGAESVEPTLTPPTPAADTPPVNPGSLTDKDFMKALAGGAGISALVFLLLGLYSSASRRSRRR